MVELQHKLIHIRDNVGGTSSEPTSVPGLFPPPTAAYRGTINFFLQVPASQALIPRPGPGQPAARRRAAGSGGRAGPAAAGPGPGPGPQASSIHTENRYSGAHNLVNGIDRLSPSQL